MKARNRLLLSGILAGVLYGALARVFFGYHRFSGVFEVMSVAFLFLVPLVLGFLTVYLGEREEPAGPGWGWARRLVVPWASSLLALASALALAWEGLICVFLWIPLFLLMSSLGGLIAGLVRKYGSPRGNQPFVLAFALLLPFAFAPLEHRLPVPEELRQVDTSIEIDAPVETVWKNIERVPRIGPAEHRFSLFHAIGFPRPVEATLLGAGVGAVRHASFEHGVLFIETITDWRPGHSLAFSIRADTASIPKSTLDEHVTVGGPFFDVLTGRYEIEPVAPGRVILHLSSTHRLSTHFNAYSGLWTSFIMRDVQEYILEILKRRCEARPARTS
ncbi:MAG TPA: hypothetical protein VMM92_12315 [Thermoanaerobaculia bacterium]|nr:hypothetical protein [Thermoanaerobaculia bacterium]